MDNGTSHTRTGQSSPPNGEPGTARGADVSPPGSRERSESDVTGWTPEREAETRELRQGLGGQGRFHRAASERLYNPRGGPTAGNVGPRDDSGTMRSGPMNMDDRDESWRRASSGRTDERPGSSRGMRARDEDALRWDDTARTWREDDGGRVGGDMSMDVSERARYGERRSAEYRANRGDMHSGNPGGRGEMRGRDTEGWGDRSWREERWGGRGDTGPERYDAALGLSSASPGIPGRGVGPGGLLGRGTEGRTGGRMDTGTGMGTEGRRRWQREPLTAREIMTRNIKTVRRDSPLREVAQIMKDEDCGVVPIVDERGALLGLVTDRDLVIRAFTGGKTPDAVRVGDVMTDDIEAVTPEQTIHDIIELMGRRQVRRIPVVDRDDRLLGLISMGDIANRADYDEELQEALDRVSARRSFWSRMG
jgi:CBS domain-containing protein